MNPFSTSPLFRIGLALEFLGFVALVLWLAMDIEALSWMHSAQPVLSIVLIAVGGACVVGAVLGAQRQHQRRQQRNGASPTTTTPSPGLPAPYEQG